MTLTSDLQGHVTNQLAIPNNLGVGTLRILLGLLQSGRLTRKIAFLQILPKISQVEVFRRFVWKKLNFFVVAPNDAKRIKNHFLEKLLFFGQFFDQFFKTGMHSPLGPPPPGKLSLKSVRRFRRSSPDRRTDRRTDERTDKRSYFIKFPNRINNTNTYLKKSLTLATGLQPVILSVSHLQELECQLELEV